MSRLLCWLMGCKLVTVREFQDGYSHATCSRCGELWRVRGTRREP